MVSPSLRRLTSIYLGHHHRCFRTSSRHFSSCHLRFTLSRTTDLCIFYRLVLPSLKTSRQSNLLLRRGDYCSSLPVQPSYWFGFVGFSISSTLTTQEMIFLKSLRFNILETKTSQDPLKFQFGPFNSFGQKRWKKPVISARTHLESRTTDLKLDRLMVHLKKLKIVLKIHELMSNKKRGPFVSVQLMSRWKNLVGLNVGMGEFVHKHPHVFEIFTHPQRRNLCCRMTCKMIELINEEEGVIRECEMDAVKRIKKLLMMSRNETLHIHALRLIRRELGLPADFRESILRKYPTEFKLIDLETVELVSRDESLTLAMVEDWREREYREKWLSEFETRYAFFINLPTGYKIERGFREKLKNWQRLPYLKPYERKEAVRMRTCGGIERFEKRVVGILHELLSLTVEKMVPVERLAHFRKEFCMEVNMRELILKHPGIFYISTRGGTQTVFLRGAYSRGCLVEPNAISAVRRKILFLIILGSRNTKKLQIDEKKIKERSNNVIINADKECNRDGDWVISIMESHVNESFNCSASEISDLSGEEFQSESDVH